MSRYTRLPRARVKKRDEFISFIDHASYFFSQYKAASLGVLAVVFLVILGSIWMNSQAEKKRSFLAQSLYEAVNAADPVASLSDLKSKTDSSLAWQVDANILEKQKEKKDAAYLDTIQKLSGVPDTLSPLLIFSQAQAYWQQNKKDEALKILDSYQSEFFAEDIRRLKDDIAASK